ncbi:Membrane protein involved in the export of O-antigen and teichoic acid [Geodermatophilus nigrescens]|uniref:Membrane protein involved in the export of O-antigen and teichoic acid n=2 Tax=Geodermatophilus nigrescens TaxID=1070870 RepID=A0A1M5D407_9ACTN|nr:Membrane protein involved in the export of O-antigen and teichoic acid [Geodermatophilus nigrescens]
MTSGLVVMYVISTRLGPEAYGFFVGAQALVATLGMVSYAAVAQLLMQGIVRDRRPPQQVLSACLTLLAAAAAAAFAVGLALQPLLFPGLALQVFVLLAVAELVGAGVVSLGAAYLQAMDRYRHSVLVRLVLLVLRTSTVVVLVTGGQVSLIAVAWTYCVLGLLAAGTVLGQLMWRERLSLRPAVPRRRDVGDGASFAGALLAFSVHEDVDKILMVRLTDPATAGLYGAAYRAVQVAAAPIKALVTASHRRFLQHDDDRKGEHVRRSFRFTLLGTAYGLTAGLIVVMAAPLLPLVLGEDYEGSVDMVRVLAALVVLRGLGGFAFNGLLGFGAHGHRLVVITGAATTAAVLTVVLVPHLSWLGGALATLMAEAVFVLGSWAHLVRRQHRHDSAVTEADSADGSVLHDEPAR